MEHYFVLNLRGYRILGIDPAKDIAEEANKKGLETINIFLILNFLTIKNFPSASIITANNVFAHCDDLIGIVKGVKIYFLKMEYLYLRFHI